MEFINVALPKGRLGEKVYAMFEQSGYECPSIKETNRKLIFENAEVEAKVTLSVQKNKQKVEVTIPFNGVILRSEEFTDDMYKSIDLVENKLERQIRSFTYIHIK